MQDFQQRHSIYLELQLAYAYPPATTYIFSMKTNRNIIGENDKLTITIDQVEDEWRGRRRGELREKKERWGQRCSLSIKTYLAGIRH